jgi:predicted nucleotidyltransferase
VRLLAEEARQSLNIRQVILFGSYAKGTATDESDIDIAIVTDAPVADWLEASAELYRISGNIDLALEPHLFDYEHDRSGFLAEIRRTGEVIYDRESV